MRHLIKKGSGGEKHTLATPPEPEALTASRAVGDESLVEVSDSSGESPILQVNATEIARIRTLATELLELVTRLESEAVSAQEDLGDGDDEKDAPPAAPYKPRTWNPVIRPGGISREDEIELALEHATTGVTATYSALRWLQEHVEIEKKGKLWSLTAKGRARPDEIRKYMAEYQGWKGERDSWEAATTGSPEAGT
jgi:hypothetical protein